MTAHDSGRYRRTRKPGDSGVTLTAERTPPPRERGGNLVALVEALHTTERQLAELRADGSGTSVEGEPRAILVRRARRQRRQCDIAKQAAILNALPACIALLDTAGFIVAVNEAWKRYDRAGAAYAPGHDVGVNYLEVCDRASATQSSTSRQIADGIRAVLDTSRPGFSMEYSFKPSAIERRVVVTIAPIDAARASGAVVMHLDVTAERLIEENLRTSESRFRQMAENINDVFFLREATGSRIFYVSPAYESIWGRTCESLYANPESWMEAIHPDDREAAIDRENAVALAGRFAAEFRIVRPDGSMRWIDSQVFPVRDDEGEVVRVAGIATDITDRKLALEAMRESEARYRTLTDASFDAIIVTEAGIILEANAGFERMFGYPLEEVVGRPARDFYAFESAERDRERASADIDGTFDLVGRHKDGTKLLLELTARPHRMGDRHVRIAALRDMTERRRLEDQIKQAQRMDAVGRLAAGVAHDFNNQLTVITAYAGFLFDGLDALDPARLEVAEIQKAATGAAGLTQQLLAFSRQQVIAPCIVALDKSVADSVAMLKRLLGEDVDLTTAHTGQPATVLIDPGQVEQIIMNLVVNARDAMPTGGKLSVETRVVDLDEDYALAHWPATAGRFAMLAVSDTGIGMDTETRRKVFEPFFTTKGSGTGLGLATVYGIVKQSGGSIWVYSEPGHGASFKIYLPFVAGEAAERRPSKVTRAMLTGTETILLAEDAPAVRRAIRQTLERFGYRVHEAATGAIALEFARGSETIDLLLTDVVMPEMSGRVLAEQFCIVRPDVKVLYMSGYTDDAVLRHGVLSSVVDYIEKPFTSEHLARKVREMFAVRRDTAGDHGGV